MRFLFFSEHPSVRVPLERFLIAPFVPIILRSWSGSIQKNTSTVTSASRKSTRMPDNKIIGNNNNNNKNNNNSNYNMNNRNETKTDQEKRKQQLFQLYHSILFTKFYANIETQHCTQWTQLLQQKLSKDDLQMMIDFESFTYQLFNQHHIDILDLPISLQLLGQNEDQSFIKNGVKVMFHIADRRRDNR